jgi:hypothetical protein
MLSAVMLSPDSSLNLTNMLLPVAFVAFSDPKVSVNVWFEYDVPSMILSPDVNAHPLDPFPPLPVSAPGTPEPPYVMLASNQPFKVEAESIAVPGAAMKQPDTVPVSLTVKLAIVVLRNANV